MSTPSRPRSHQLETESRIAFQDVLPSRWVYREVTPDYGIDAGVEIFDANNAATGLHFHVQIRGTDEPDLNKALAFRLSAKHDRLYARSHIPVLLVRYHGPTQALYYRWWHYRREVGVVETESTTIRFHPENQLTSETAPTLEADVRSYYRWAEAYTPFPIEVGLTSSLETVQGLTTTDLALRLKREYRALADLLSFKSGAVSAGSVTVHFDPHHASIDVGGVAGIDWPVEIRGSDHTEALLVADVVTLVALALALVGREALSAQIIARCLPIGNVIRDPGIASDIADLLLSNDKVDELLDVAEAMVADPESEAGGAVLLLAAGSLRNGSTGEEQSRVDAIHARRSATAGGIGDTARMASAWYSKGNSLRARGASRDAVHAYRIAAQLDPNYRMRSYWHRELGGVLFIAGRYRLSAQYYANAIQLGDEAALPLFADALFSLGHVEAALNVYRAFLALVEEDPEPEVILRTAACNAISQSLGIGNQERNPLSAMDLARTDPAETPLDIAMRMIAALNEDILCQTAWFNLGVARSALGQPQESRIAFLIAALIDPADVDAWANAIILDQGVDDFGPEVLQVALENAGEDLLVALENHAETLDSEEVRQKFLDGVATLHEMLPQVRGLSDLTVRVIDSGPDA